MNYRERERRKVIVREKERLRRGKTVGTDTARDYIYIH